MPDDAGLVLRAAERAGLELPTVAAARRHLGRAVELGLGGEDMAAAVEALR